MDAATKTAPTELPSSLTDIGKPSLHALSYALRHPDTWPEGFVWEYSDCRNCAMGLAHQLWNEIPWAGVDSGASLMARHFAMPYSRAKSIFFQTQWHSRIMGIFPRSYSSVSPEMVADQIDKYLATAE